MAFTKVESPSGKTFHWKCDNPDCPYESTGITISKGTVDATPPRKCPKCGKQS